MDTTTPKTPIDTSSKHEIALRYLKELFAGAPDDARLVIWDKATLRSRYFYPSQLEEAADQQLKQAQVLDVYFGWSLQPDELPHGKRGTAKTAICSPGIFMDVDLKGPAHAEPNLPETEEQVFRWIKDAGILTPTFVRRSGYGLYLDWVHPRPVIFSNEADRSRYAARVESFHKALRHSAFHRYGWKLDQIQDLARVTRLPGTLNHKLGTTKEVELIND